MRFPFRCPPRGTQKQSIRGRSRECVNAEFEWEFKRVFQCEGGRKWSCLLTRVSVRRASTTTEAIRFRVRQGTHNALTISEHRMVMNVLQTLP